MTHQPVEPISVSGKEASRLTGVPLSTLRQWTTEGRVPAARRLGKSYIYVLSELRDMIVNARPIGGAAASKRKEVHDVDPKN